jgi:hypothetical protein
MNAWMAAAFSPSVDPQAMLIGAGLLLIFLLTGARLVWRRPRLWPARLGLQALALLLIWRLLCPPALPLAEPGQIDVLGAGWRAALDAHPQTRLNPASALIALPEAQAPLPAGVSMAPDLASLLRRHPGARLRLIGEGFAARDQEAAHGRLAQWLPAALPAGLVELHAPSRVAEGADVQLHGRWRGTPPMRLELHDVAGSVLASQGFSEHSPAQAPRDDAPHEHEFTLSLPARAAAELPMHLVAIDSDGAARALLRLPLRIESAPGLRIGLLAGAPGAELRALRRWAVDAGHAIDSRIVLSRGRVLGGSASFDADALAKLDLLIVDERAWAALGERGREDVDNAVEAGLGLLLRPLALPARAQWPLYADQGFQLQAEAAAVERSLAGAPAGLRTLPLSAQAERALPLLEDREGAALGLWRPRGLGRVGLLWLGETQGLVGRGEARAHARLWAQLSATLARAGSSESTPLQLAPSVQSPEALAWLGERSVVCGIEPGAPAQLSREDPDPAAAPATALFADARGCAALWPRSPGWHRIRSGGNETVLNVVDPNELPSLYAAQRSQGTRSLLGQPLQQGNPSALAPGPAWPWLPPLLIVLALQWWLERPGLRSASPN